MKARNNIIRKLATLKERAKLQHPNHPQDFPVHERLNNLPPSNPLVGWGGIKPE